MTSRTDAKRPPFPSVRAALSAFAGDDTPFLLRGEAGLSRDALSEQALALAARLVAETPGKARIAIRLSDPVAAVAALYGVLASGRAAVPIDPRAPEDEAARLIAASDVAAVVAAPGTDPVAPLIEMPTRTAHAPDLPAPAPDDLALILYTSGSTGAPKGVEIRHRALDWVIDLKIRDFFRTTARDTLLLAAPVSNMFTVALSLVALRAAARLALPAEPGPAALAETIRRHDVTFIAGVPPLAEMLLKTTEAEADPFPALQHMMLAGTALDLGLADRLEQHFGLSLILGYGMNEALPICYAHDRHKVPAGASGRLAEDTEVRIVDSDMRPCAPGEIGEILIRGPQVTLGYWAAPDQTRAAFHEGWFRSGYAGRLDAEGFLFFVDRLKDVIKTGGHTVYPAEVEAMLRRHGAVDEAAVLAAPGRHLGEVIAAFVRLKPGETARAVEIKTWCKARMAPYKVPRLVRFVTDFPMTPTGKISKPDLRKRLGP